MCYQPCHLRLQVAANHDQLRHNAPSYAVRSGAISALTDGL